MSSPAGRRLADALAEAMRHTPQLRLDVATVTALAGAQVVVDLDGASLTVPRLAGYTPTVGEVVLILGAGPGRIVLGAPAT